MKTPLRLFSTALVLVVAGALRAQSNYATPHAFTTLAGNAGYGAADGPPAAARFNGPTALAADGAGNIYVADTYNCTIRKITPSGLVTTLAGAAGVSGAVDGAGSAARFARPAGVAVDDGGDVYVADTGNSTIRKIASDGTVTTVAGKAGNLGSTDGPGSAARFYSPQGLAVNAAGEVFVADISNHTIRKIGLDGAVTTVAGAPGVTGAADGTGSAARFYQPSGLAVDTAGNLYVADSGNDTIRKIAAGGVVTTIAGASGPTNAGTADGIGTAARFATPLTVAVDAAGNLYVADSLNSTIRKIAPGGAVTTLAGQAGSSGATDGTGSAARLNNANGVTVDSAGNVWVADTGNNTIRKIASGGVVTTMAAVAGSVGATDGVGSAARFYAPSGVALDSAGNVYVADTDNHTIRKITSAGVVTTLAGQAGSFGAANGTGSAARFYYPSAVAVDSAGNVYVAETGNHTIRKITSGGAVTTLAGLAGTSGAADGTGSAARFNAPQGVAVDGAGNVYVGDTLNNTIRKITSGGVVTTLAGAAGVVGAADGPVSAARFYHPQGLAVDSAGNVYVADTANNAVRKIGAGGAVTTLAGQAGTGNFGSTDGPGSSARLYNPQGVAVDSAGNVLVADSLNNTIRKIGLDGVVTTLAGLAGDANQGAADGAGSAARFYNPAGVAVDGAGVLYVADSHNYTIRRGMFFVPVAGLTTTSQAPTPASGDTATLAAASTGFGLTYQWQLDGAGLAGATNATLTVPNFQPANTGLYTYAVAVPGGAGGTGDPAIVGVATTSKVIGAGSEIAHGVFVAFNGNTFDQVLPSGAAVTVTAEPKKITRTSFVDLTNDIVQVEFSGAGTLSLVLDSASGPAPAVNYNQPGTVYMKGHAGIVITGANETTNVAVFSVGTLTAVNQALFRSDVKYDGLADLAFIAIASTNGKFGTVRTANATYYASKGLTGLYAPGVQFTGPVYIGDINASGTASPVIVLGSALSDTAITGGDLFQANGQPVKVSGLTQLTFTAGSTSHGAADLPAQANKAVLLQNGVDVTAQLVGNTGP